jgi:GNAT superfamily N-acetyltransferase
MSVDVSVVPLDDVEAAFEIDHAALEWDYPDIPHLTLAEFRSGVERPQPGVDVEHYLGLLDGVPVGYLAIEVPRRDNLDNLMIKLMVHPARRRNGVGRALFGHVLARAKALGRKHVAGETVRHRPDGPAFAAAMGATAALEETRSRLELPPDDQGRLDALLADAREHARGYQLVRWTGVPPAEIIDSVAEMESSFLGEAPVGDLAWEGQTMDAARLRDTEQRRIDRGKLAYNTGALHGDRVVAWTALVSSVTSPHHAWQSLTLVAPEHRGHRLGLLVKLENLAYARAQQPVLAAIDTYNGDVNEHMLRINRAMGFQAKDGIFHWQWSA